MHNTVLSVKNPNNIRSNPSPAIQWNYNTTLRAPICEMKTCRKEHGGHNWRCTLNKSRWNTHELRKCQTFHPTVPMNRSFFFNFMIHIHQWSPKLQLEISQSLQPSPPPPVQQAAVELLHFLLFLSTPSSHPPSLPPSLLLSLPPPLPPFLPPPLRFRSLQSSTGEKKSSSCFFSLKRAEANWILAGLQFSGLWLQAGGGRRRRRDRTREAGKKVEGREGRKKTAASGHFLKPPLRGTAATDGPSLFYHNIN